MCAIANRTPPSDRTLPTHGRRVRLVDGRDATEPKKIFKNVGTTVTTYFGVVVVVCGRLVEDVQRRRIVEQHVHDAQRAFSVFRHSGRVGFRSGQISRWNRTVQSNLRRNALHISGSHRPRHIALYSIERGTVGGAVR